MACVKCGSDVLIEGVRIIDFGGTNYATDLSVRVDRNPGALLFKGSVSEKIVVRVCGGCGFIEMYAKDPGKLLRASKDRKKR